ncbi:MAG: hypothetical protein HQ488_03420 [Parcubacteria group bacterium]|nr:hypothetical protein [Parcubacteria group bacterium]
MAGPDPDQNAEFWRRFRRFGGTDPTMKELLGDDELMEWWITSLNERRNSNPFEISVKESLDRLRAAYDDTFCPLGAKEPTSSELTHLERMAPNWPKGKDAFRSFQVRPAAFGEGRDGVINTFEATCASVKLIHDPKFWRWELLLSGAHPYQGEDVERLRLLGGNERHTPGVCWVTFNLSEGRQRADVTSVRSGRSLSDAGIFAARMFPDRAKAIDYEKKPAWFCAGYELNVPERADEPWQYVPCVHRNVRYGTVPLRAHWRGDANSRYSVPSVGE